MQPFTPNPDRDAYATIRGFVYQIDLTILRWLDVQPGQALELEAGEDIDLVADALNTNPFPLNRLLEQVKHREQSVTLRSVSALEAIANAIEHRATHTGHKLVFRYSTNASIGKEYALPGGSPYAIPYLELWEKLRKKKDAGCTPSEGAAAIKTFITALQKPEKLNAASWTRLQTFFARPETDILDFVANVEWATGGQAADRMQSAVEDRLLALTLATDRTQAEQQYQRLFLYVFKVLCQAGTERLTPEERTHQLSLPTLSQADHVLLEQVHGRLQVLEIRLGSVEQLVSTLNKSVADLAARADITAQIVGPELPRTDPPPLPARLALRAETVSAVAAHFGAAAWVVLHGGEDVGKTTLGALVAQHLGTLRGWIRSGAGSDSEAVRMLERGLASLVIEPMAGDRQAWDDRLCTALGAGSLLVVDAVPDLAKTPELAERLRTLARACRARAVRLLTLGVRPVPEAIASALEPGVVVSLPVPFLTEPETAEFLKAYGAPDTLREPGSVRFLRTLTEGHPVLLGAATLYLASNGWILQEEVLSKMLAGAHAGGVAEDVLQRLMASVTKPARELLYRLSIVRHPFSLAEVDAVGTVPPPVASRREVLAEVTGPWVRRSDDGEYAVSPLLTPVGESALDTDIRRPCHGALGEALVKRESLTTTEGLRAINHFMAGEQFNKAGTLFLMGLAAVSEAGICTIGDGGLGMTIAELETCVRERLHFVTVVYNDSSLSLIDVAQARRGYPTAGVRYGPVDFAAAAAAMGAWSQRVQKIDDLDAAVHDAMRADRPAVIDVVVDPFEYHAHTAAWPRKP